MRVLVRHGAIERLAGVTAVGICIVAGTDVEAVGTRTTGEAVRTTEQDCGKNLWHDETSSGLCVIVRGKA